MTMRRGGPHPCLPGVPFVILTLHSGMEGETERQRGRKVERDREGAGEGGGGGKRVCAGRHGDTTHTHVEKERQGGVKSP